MTDNPIETKVRTTYKVQFDDDFGPEYQNATDAAVAVYEAQEWTNRFAPIPRRAMRVETWHGGHWCLVGHRKPDGWWFFLSGAEMAR